MKKANIIRNGILTNTATMPEAELLVWLEKHKKMGSFGNDDEYEMQPILISAAVYEDQQVLVKEAEYVEQEVLDANGQSYDPPQYQTVEVSPAEYELQSVLVQEAVYQTEEVLVKEAVTEEREVMDPATGTSYNPPQYETVVIEPAQYETKTVYQNVLVSPAEFSVTITDVTLEVAAEKEKADKIAKGKAARSTCEAVLDYISGCNLDKALTAEQITQMQATYADAESALRSGRPTHAKHFISAITPDGTIVTEEEKAECLRILAAY